MNGRDLRIVYMGTPEFAVPTLEKLNEKYNVMAVVTVPDKLKGRGKHLLPSEVKLKAIELELPIMQPISLREERFIDELKSLKPDIIVVVAFRILPPEVYKIPALGTFNIHASLLPKYRGAAPINWAIINGEKTTGLTSFLLKDEVDTGDIIIQEENRIGSTKTFGDLYDDLKHLAPAVAVDTIEILKAGRHQLIQQNDAEATQAPKLFPEQCRIDWTRPAKQVKNFINGTSPVPGAWTLYKGERIKILRADVNAGKSLNSCEFEINKKHWRVGCGDGNIDILEIQFPGKKAQKFKDIINGWRSENIGKFE